jgi:hypothetical protein
LKFGFALAGYYEGWIVELLAVAAAAAAATVDYGCSTVGGIEKVAEAA